MIRKLSPAKINLYLRVLRRRRDGYHEIASLMQRISLCDEMTFRSAARGVRVRCPGGLVPENEENIVFRAAEAFFRHASPAAGGIRITLQKHIPVAAGLGGGSSNAATTLMALNELSGYPCTRERLMEIGVALGADVPFFLFEKTAWAFGIGERLETAETIPNLPLLLVNPGFALPTQMVYQNLNLTLTNPSNHYSIPQFLTVRDVAAGLLNDLETVSIGMHPVLSDIKKRLVACGALGALMSGSGPTVFGIFESNREAAVAEEALAGMNGWSVFRAESF